MGDSDKNNSNKILPVYILLPICVELETDVFLNILKNVVARTRMDDPYLNAIRAGLSDPINVKSKDMTVSWKELKSKSQQKRQLKLIGFWAINNYPTLGKKLLGEAWNPTQRSSVEIQGDTVMTAKEIDAVIFKKLELRIIECSVSQSTLLRLKHFVTTPKSVVGKFIDIPISTKMKAYEIKVDYLENGWKSLKLGTFSMNEQPIPLDQDVRTSTEDQAICNLSQDSQLEPVAKRARLGEESTSIGSPSPPTDTGSYKEVDANDANTTDRNNGSSDDSTQAALVEIRKEIGNLTGLFHRHLSGHDTETANGPERLHVVIIKQKDQEIERMKSSVQELLQSNQSLVCEQSKSKEEIERQTVLINTLQKLADANSKLHIQSERDLTASCDLVETLKVEITELKSQIQNLSEKLAEAANTKVDMDHRYAQLTDSLNELKDNAAMKDAELNLANKTLSEKEKLQKDIDDLTAYTTKMVSNLKTQIDNLDTNLAESEKLNSETLEQKRKLEQELNVLREYAARRDDELNVEITELKSRIKNLSENLAGAANTKLDMDRRYAELQYSFNELKGHAAIKDEELNTANKTLREKEKLQKDIDDLTAHTTTIVSNLETRIESLNENLAASEKINSETLGQKQKLEKELNVLREYAAKRDDQLKEANKAFSELRQQLDWSLSKNQKKTDAETQTDTSNEDVLNDTKSRKGVLYQKITYKNGKERSHRFEQNPDSLKKARVEDINEELTEEQQTELILFFKTCVVHTDKERLKLKMNETVKFRRSLITKNETVFPELFPFYFVESDLVLYDFEISFQTIRSTAFLEKWPTIKLLILNSIFSAELDANWMVEYDENTAYFMVLAKYLCSTKGFDPSQFFVFCNDIHKDPRELRNSKIANPVILAIGETKRNISAYYIVIEQELLSVPPDFDFVLMMDLFFKIHKIFNLNYFSNIKNALNFFEYYVYEMKTADIKPNVKMLNLSKKLFQDVTTTEQKI